jgi:hypothetical protein
MYDKTWQQEKTGIEEQLMAINYRLFFYALLLYSFIRAQFLAPQLLFRFRIFQ